VSGTPADSWNGVLSAPKIERGGATWRSSKPGRPGIPRGVAAGARFTARSGSSPETNVPPGPRDTTQPCATSSSYAATIVLRLTAS
jgi:hypothetical protein